MPKWQTFIPSKAKLARGRGKKYKAKETRACVRSPWVNQRCSQRPSHLIFREPLAWELSAQLNQLRGHLQKGAQTEDVNLNLSSPLIICETLGNLLYLSASQFSP